MKVSRTNIRAAQDKKVQEQLYVTKHLAPEIEGPDAGKGPLYDFRHMGHKLRDVDHGYVASVGDVVEVEKRRRGWRC